jgi:uncharacterized protein (DUF1499 family)
MKKKAARKSLKPCSASPNCVSSMAKDKNHFVEPIQFDQSQKAAHKKLLEILKSLPRTKITISKDDYICAESTSLLFRFVDDLEFVFDANKKIIHVRSASRVGYSDLGVNRKRVESIRKKF